MMSTSDCLRDIAEARRLLGMSGGKCNNEYADEACRILEEVAVYHPFEPTLWQVYADAKLIQGKVLEAKENLARWQRLLAEEISTGQKQRLPRSDAHVSWPSHGLPAHFSSANFKAVESVYRTLKERGYDDVRLHFYAANLCKLQNDNEGFVTWLGNPALTDEFYALHIGTSSDFYNMQDRVWLQDRLFRRIDEMGPMSVEQYLPEYFRCTAFEIEMAILKLSNAIDEAEVKLSMKDSEEELRQAKNELLDKISEYTCHLEMALVCQILLLRENGNFAEVQHCSQALDYELSSPTYTAALLLGQAHLDYEMLNFEKARSIYGKAQVEAAKAIRHHDPSIFAPSVMQPLAMQADSFAGIAACDRLLGRLSVAEASVHQSLQRDPGCGDALRQLIHLYIEQKDFEAAATILCKLDHDSASSRNQMTRFTRMKIDSLNSCPAAQQRKARLQEDSYCGIELYPKHIWRHLFDLLAENMVENCTKICTSLKSPSCLVVPFPWATATSVKICQEEAESTFRLISRSDWFYECVGILEEAAGALTAALHAIESENQSNEQTRLLALKILWKRHQMYLRRGNSELALGDLSESINLMKLDPYTGDASGKELAQIHFAEAVILFKLGKQDLAQRKLIMAIKLDPGLPSAKGYLGLIYSQKGPEFKSKAFLHLQQYFDEMIGSEMNPDRSIALAFAKLLCQECDDKKQFEAVKICTQVLARNHRDCEALMVRASAFALLDRWEEALSDYSGAIGTGIKAMESASVHYYRGRAYQHLQRYSEALADFLQSKEHGNVSMMLLQNLAFTYEALGSIEEAVTVYGTLLHDKDLPQPEIKMLHWRRSELYMACSEYDHAIQDLDQIIAQDSADIEALFGRGCALLNKYERTTQDEKSQSMEVLQLALKDFSAVLKNNATHLQASMKRLQISSLMDVEIDEDENVSSALAGLERGSFDDVDPDFLCAHAILLSKELLTKNQERLFHFVEAKDNISHQSSQQQVEMLVDEEGILKTWQIHPFGEKTLLGIFDFRKIHIERKKGTVGFYPFTMRAGNGIRWEIASLKYDVREAFFRCKYHYSNLLPNSVPSLEKLLKMLQNAQQRKPKDSAPLFYMALLYECQNRLDLAKLLYVEALQHLSQSFRAKDLGQSRTVEARTTRPSALNFDQLLDPSQEGSNVLSLLLNITEPVRGLKSINRFRAKICFRLAMSQLKSTSLSDSRSHLDAVIKILECGFLNDDSRKDILFYLGWLSMKVQRYEDSARWFTLVTRAFPEFAEAFNNLGVVEEILGNNAAAIRSYHEAEALDPESNLIKSNLFILQLRTEDANAGEIIEKTSKSIESCNGNSAPTFLARGFAFSARNDSRREIPDHVRAIEDYKMALKLNASNFQARILLAHAYITHGNLADSKPLIEWLQSHNANAEVLSELNCLSLKIDVMYRATITDFVFAAMLNPHFHSLHYTKPNVDVGVLEFDGTSIMSGINTAHHQNASDQVQYLSFAAKECINEAKKCSGKGDYSACAKEITKLLSHLNQNDLIYSRALAWRAVMLARASEHRLACIDCESAMRTSGILNLFPDQSDGDAEMNASSKVPSVGSATADKKFGYALMCFLGSLKECADISDYKGPSKCYHNASELIPDRLEAHINLANLSRKFKSYEVSLSQYMELLKRMCDEEASTESKYQSLQHKLFILMSKYRSKWNGIVESAIHNDANIDKATVMNDLERLQGELIWLCEEFRQKASDRISGSESSLRIQSASREVMQVANKCIGLFCKNPSMFLVDRINATSMYCEYIEVLEQLYESLIPGFESSIRTEESEFAQAVQDFLSSTEELSNTTTHIDMRNPSSFVKAVFSWDKCSGSMSESDSIENDLNPANVGK